MSANLEAKTSEHKFVVGDIVSVKDGWFQTMIFRIENFTGNKCTGITGVTGDGKTVLSTLSPLPNDKPVTSPMKFDVSKLIKIHSADDPIKFSWDKFEVQSLHIKKPSGEIWSFHVNAHVASGMNKEHKIKKLYRITTQVGAAVLLDEQTNEECIRELDNLRPAKVSALTVMSKEVAELLEFAKQFE